MTSRTVSIRQFSPSEDQLTAEASDLGFRAGEVPEWVDVEGVHGEWAQFHLELVTEAGWQLKLTGYGEKTDAIRARGEDGPSMWCPRKMVLFND